jgi:hypothetical protein
MSEAERATHRKHEAKRLEDQGFSLEAIAALLSSSKSQIGRDLKEFSRDGKTPLVVSKRGRKGEGRPKGPAKKNPQATEDYVASLVLDHGQTYQEAATAAGLGSVQVVKTAVAHERGRRAGIAIVDIDTLPKTSKEKVEAWQRRETRRMELEFEQRLQAKLKEHYDRLLPEYEQKLRDAEDIVRRRKGIMSAREFRLIVSCLHPDRIQDEELKRRYADAFNIMNAVRLVLVAEKEEPTSTLAWPRTYQEMMAKKAKVSAARKAKRTQSNLARKGA